MKRCSKCEKLLDEDQFYRNKQVSSGRMSACKKCANAACEGWRKRNLSKANEHRRAYKYGLNAEELRKFLQVPSCQSCGVELETDHQIKIDHCHDAGHVRGVLCNKCNIACAGTADEALVRLHACIAYLLRDKERTIEQARAG